MMEYKILESHIRLRGIPEEEGENIYELILDKRARKILSSILKLYIA